MVVRVKLGHQRQARFENLRCHRRHACERTSLGTRGNTNHTSRYVWHKALLASCLGSLDEGANDDVAGTVSHTHRIVGVAHNRQHEADELFEEGLEYRHARLCKLSDGVQGIHSHVIVAALECLHVGWVDDKGEGKG